MRGCSLEAIWKANFKVIKEIPFFNDVKWASGVHWQQIQLRASAAVPRWELGTGTTEDNPQLSENTWWRGWKFPASGRGFFAQLTKPHGADVLALTAGTEQHRVMPSKDEDLCSVPQPNMPFCKGWHAALWAKQLLVPHWALAHTSRAFLPAEKSGNVALCCGLNGTRLVR